MTLLLMHCTTSAPPPKEEPPAVATQSELQFTVANSADTSMTLPGVSVSVLMANGDEVPAGKTGALGIVRVSKSLLAPNIARAVLFCEPSFFCTTVRADDQENDLRRWDEYFVTLAPVVVR